MGFITGYLSGLTLTSSVLYLSIRLHHATRLQQSVALRDSSALLRTVYDPQPAFVPPSARPERVAPAGLADAAKDRWNAGLERAVRRVYSTDWRRVREDGEGWARSAWERVAGSK